MSYAQRHTVSVTTDGSGDATSYTNVVTGRVVNVIYTADGSTPFAATADFTITGESTGLSIWTEANVTASKTVSPVQAGNINTSGAASALTEPPVYVANERIKIVVAQGGASKVGSFVFVIA